MKNYTFNIVEKKWQDIWRENETYRFDDEDKQSEKFIVDTPPPTVSGDLHMGHIYSYTNADFIVRFQRMRGRNVFYPIGFDDNGLPTERLVEKKQNIRAVSTDRAQFKEICQQVIAEEIEKFRGLFDKIALSVDWNLEYHTISSTSQAISQMSFLDLAEKGEVYRNTQPILWDPVDQTALAQADIEDKEKASFMNEIKFSSSEGEDLIIATTRPELLPACVAVFYHPEDARYQHLAGKMATAPLFAIEVPLLPDDLVQPDKGTGLVMCCTYGDSTDIIWQRKHNLPINIIINKRGAIELSEVAVQTASERARGYMNELNGLKVSEARSKIIELLKSSGLLVKQTEITQTVKCAERSGAPLEILATDQWFVHTIKHKQALLDKANELNWYPKFMKIRLDNWINGINWDWCISRQRYFGVPFPVWYSKRPGEEGKILFATKDQLPVDPAKDLPEGYSREEVVADMDVMDTWATSSVSPQLSSMGISGEYYLDIEKHKNLFPATLRPQAHEILRTWAFYTILKAHLHEEKLPWRDIMISGWCLAGDGSKMSKSKGNSLSPEKLLDTHGSDAIRYWASNAALGADTCYSEDTVKTGKRLINKLWNSVKYVSQHFAKLENIDTQDTNFLQNNVTAPIDIWLVDKLDSVIELVTKEMKKYEYATAINYIERFFWTDFCDNYLEITKTRTYDEENKDRKGSLSAVATLYYTMQVTLRLFAPFVPHVTEELYQLFSESSIHAKGNWPVMQNLKIDFPKDQVECLICALGLIRKAKASENLSVKTPIKLLQIKGMILGKELKEDLMHVANAEDIDFITEFSFDGKRLEEDNVAVNILFEQTT